MRRKQKLLSRSEVSLGRIPRQRIEVQTSPLERPSVPPWFAEVAILPQHLARKGRMSAFTHQIRLVRGHFGHYEPRDFLVLLIGYAISGERRLSDFFERLAPFGAAFMALFGALPHGKSSFDRFKHLLSSDSALVCPPRSQRRSSALEQ